MAINTLQYATLFQRTLDKVAVREALTGWMDKNAGKVKYTGGAEVKVPKMSVSGLGDYDRDNGYPQGSVNLDYETRKMTQDRGRLLNLDAVDVDETNFVANASEVMGEFQREHVIPEIDAYRLSKIATTAIETAKHVKYGYTPADTTILREIKTGIKDIRKRGFMGQLIIHISEDAMMEVELALLNRITVVDFTKGGVKTKVPAIDYCPLIGTPENRMYSSITMLDGVSEGQKEGGYVKGETAKNANFLIMPMTTPIGVTKQDKVRIFDPNTTQAKNAWQLDYRRYHDLWVLDNKKESIYANFLDAE